MSLNITRTCFSKIAEIQAQIIGLTTLVFTKLMKMITLLGGKKHLQYHMTGKNLPTDCSPLKLSINI